MQQENSSRIIFPHRTTVYILLVSFFCGLLIWLFDAVIDFFLYREQTFLETAITHILPHDLFFRTLIFILFMLFGIIASVILKKQRFYAAAHQKTGRAYKMLASCAQILLHAEDEKVLLEEICRVITETGGYLMAWVGFARDDQHRSVEFIAGSGTDGDYRKNLKISWDDNEYGRGPTGRAIRTGVLQTIDDINRDPHYLPWRRIAHDLGYQSSIALPLQIKNKVIGALNIYSRTAERFNMEEIDILKELAADISFGLLTLRINESHRRAQIELAKSSERLDAIVDATPRAIIVVDSDMNVQLWNPAAEFMFGWSENEIIFKPLPLFEAVMTENMDIIRNQLLSGTVINEVESVGVKKNGSIVDMRLSAAPLRNIDGNISEILFILENKRERKQMLASLRERGALLNSIFRASPAGIGLMTEHTMGWCNDYMEQLTGYSPKELMGLSARILYHDNKEFERIYREQSIRAKNDEIGSIQTRWKKKDGTAIDVLLSTAVLEPDDSSQELVYTALDITERNNYLQLIKTQKDELEASNEELALIIDNLEQSQQELYEINRQLAESERLHRLLAENSTDVIWTMTLDGCFTYISPSVTALGGFSPEEVLSMNLKDYVDPESYRTAMDTITYELNKSPEQRLKSYLMEMKQYAKDGTMIDIEISCTWIYDEQGNPVAIQGSTRDIHARKVMEEHLHVLNQRLSTIINSSPLSIFILDREGKVLLWNKTAEKTFGWNENDVLDHTLPIVPHEKLDEFYELISRVFSGESLMGMEIQRIKKDGSPLLLSLNSAPLYDTEGEVNAIISIVADITKSRQAKAALIASEEKFSRVFHTSPDSININRLHDGLYIDINDGFTTMTGYTREETIGKSSIELDIWADPLDREKLASMLKISGEALGFEAQFRMKDGTIRTGLMSAKIITIENQPCIISITRDITDMKKAREAVREERDRAQMYLDIAGVIFVALDSEGKITLINKKGCDVLGYVQDEVIGKYWIDTFIPERMRKDVWTVFRQIVDAPSQPFQYYENPVLTRDGTERIIAWKNTILTDHSGKVTGSLSSGEDITERLAAEESIRRSLVEKELLLKEIHHRVKNNLGIIYSLLHFQKGSIEDRNLVEILENTQNRVRSMALIHQKLYKSEELNTIDFADYVKDLLDQVLNTSSYPGLNITTEVTIQDIKMDIDTVLSCGLIINELVTNSLKYGFAGRDSGLITVEFHYDDAGMCNLKLADNGIGLPGSFNVNNRKNLGMFILRSLSQQLGGTFQITSDKGVTAIITFPYKSRQPE